MTLKTKSCHDANFVITGGTRGCHYDNLWWPPVMTKLASWQQHHHDPCLRHHFYTRQSVNEIGIMSLFLRDDNNGSNWNYKQVKNKSITHLLPGISLLLVSNGPSSSILVGDTGWWRVLVISKCSFRYQEGVFWPVWTMVTLWEFSKYHEIVPSPHAQKLKIILCPSCQFLGYKWINLLMMMQKLLLVTNSS